MNSLRPFSLRTTMALLSQCLRILVFGGLLLVAGSLHVAENTHNAPKETVERPKEGEIHDAIVLIDLSESSSNRNDYYATPIVEKNIMSLIKGNSTLAEKIVGDARNSYYEAHNAASKVKDPLSQTRLLPLVSTPKKALILFALHETLHKGGHYGGAYHNCVVLSKDDLLSLLEGEETGNRQVEFIH